MSLFPSSSCENQKKAAMLVKLSRHFSISQLGLGRGAEGLNYFTPYPRHHFHAPALRLP